MKKLILVIALAALSTAASCPPHPSPGPVPTPTPTPGPTPTPTPSPTPTPTPSSSMLLRINSALHLTDLDGNVVHFRQFIGYTVPGHDEINSRWPAISTAAMDFYAPYGANAFHMRLGPFIANCTNDQDPNCGETLWADIGGGYNKDGSFNEAFFQAIDQAVTYAESKRWWVEVNIIDTWGCKYSQAGNPYSGWSGAALAACGRTAGDPTEEAWLRKWVALLTHHANVIWLLDNEGDNIIHADQSWYDWQWKVIRDQEQKSGINVHLTGANPTFLGNADYTYTHAPQSASTIKGKLTFNNEHNPSQYDADAEASAFAFADQRGDVTYAYWQDDADDITAVTTLNKIRAFLLPGQCFTPPGEDPAWNQTPSSGGNGNRRAAVSAAESALGSQCGQPPPTTLESLAAQLRSQKLCSSKTNDGVFVWDSGSQYQEFHAVSYGDGCWTQISGQPKNTWTYTQAVATPPVIPSDTCGDPQPPPLNKWNLILQNPGPNWNTYDATPLVHGGAYCAAIGYTDGRLDCPARIEGAADRVACETKIVGSPVWSGPGEVVPGSPYDYRVRPAAHGTIQVCNTIAPVVCATITQ